MKLKGNKIKNTNIKEKINWEEKRRITLIALIITIIVLLILAAVSIATLTGENGILTRANMAGEETKEQGALEKVKIAILGSYDTKNGYKPNNVSGNLDYKLLKENLEAINGYESMSETGEITEDSFPLIVVVNGEKIRIHSNGEVELIYDNIVPPTSYDAEFDLSENQDESIIAYVVENKIIIIGVGKMKDYNYSNYPFANLNNTITEVEVSEGITNLGAYIFGRYDTCGQITDIQLPSTLKKIGQGAFYSTRNLKTVHFNGTRTEWFRIDIENVGTHNYYLTNKATIICTDEEITP